jgi:predicted nucleotidyltransferase
MIDLQRVLVELDTAGVEFIVVGGVAATVHGSARVTQDLDIVYARTPENIRRLAATLTPWKPYLRGAPAGLPFRWDADTVRQGLNFTLTTTLGDLDLLGEIAGGGGYDALLPHAETISLFGRNIRCLGLQKLIAVKRAAGRPRDLEAIAELEALAEEADGPSAEDTSR